MKLSDDQFAVSPLPLARRPVEQPPVTLEEVTQVAEKAGRGGMWEARQAAIVRSGLLEAEVRDALGVAANTWSAYKLPRLTDGRPTKGAKNFPEELLPEFDQIVGNTLVTQVHAFRAGLECKPLQTEIERQLAEARRALEESRRENEIILAAVQRMNGR